MSSFTLPLLSLALLLLLFGCAQGGIPSACANSPVDKLSNCIYVAAVLEQNPYDCYSLQENTQREKCLRDASDSSAKKSLEQMTPSERANIFVATPEAANASGISSIPFLPPANEPANSNASPAIITPKTGVSEADSQAYVQAIAANDMSPCITITDASTRASCITQVAIRVKKLEVCSQLTQKADIDLCNLYAKAGEQAK